MVMDGEKKGAEIELEQAWAVIGLPTSAVYVSMDVTICLDGEIKKVCTSFDPQEIRTAFRKAEEGYIDEDERFVFTEEGKAYLESLLKEDV